MYVMSSKTLSIVTFVMLKIFTVYPKSIGVVLVR